MNLFSVAYDLKKNGNNIMKLLKLLFKKLVEGCIQKVTDEDLKFKSKRTKN